MATNSTARSDSDLQGRMLDQSFTVNADHHEYHFSVRNGFLRLHKREGSSGEVWWTGDFLDPRGTVTVYRQQDYTRLDFVRAGTAHVRCWDRYWGDRTICRLARAFITDLADAA